MIVFCFDLDDTLYKEISYLHSAYKEISEYIYRQLNGTMPVEQIFSLMLSAYNSGENTFKYLNEFTGLTLPIEELLSIYRNHYPNIKLSLEAYNLLDEIKAEGNVIGIISDGRSKQQRNKIAALGLARFIKDEDIIISEEVGREKPSEENYVYFMKRYPYATEWVYIGDNLKKDFIAPNKLGWKSVCLKDDGRNIHKQDFNCDMSALPKYIINRLDDIRLYIK